LDCVADICAIRADNFEIEIEAVIGKEPWHGAARPIFLSLIVPALLLNFVLGILHVFMKVSVNLDLPEGKKLSWWARNDYGLVRRTYAVHNPNSILPDVSMAGWYLMIVLVIAAALAGFWPD
jgi:hypothetical protein